MMINRLKPIVSKVLLRTFAPRKGFNVRQFSTEPCDCNEPDTLSLTDLIRKYKGERTSNADSNPGASSKQLHDNSGRNNNGVRNEEGAKPEVRTYHFDGGEFSKDHIGDKFMAKEIFPDGSKYIGEWQNGQRNGLGIFTNSSGGKYEGEFLDGKCHGQGKRFSASGHVVEGEFRLNRLYNGSGVSTSDKNNEKRGVWEKGVFTGVWKRKIHLKENSSKHTAVCTWEIEKNEHVGMGTEEHWDGTKYEGYWLKKQRHGEGTLTTARGHVFKGVWHEGKVVSGEGSLILPWGDICHGTWVDGLMEGLGRIEYVERQMVYEGEIQHGQHHGYGTLSYANGRCYMGSFVKGRKHGKGRFVELLQEGEWVNDKFQGITVRALQAQKRREYEKEKTSQQKERTNHRGHAALHQEEGIEEKRSDDSRRVNRVENEGSIYDGYDIRLN